MLGARTRLRPLPLSLVGWCASCNNNNNNNNNNNSGSTFRDVRGAVHPLLLPGMISWASKGWPCGRFLKSILMVKLNFHHRFPEMCNICCGLTWRDVGNPYHAETPFTVVSLWCASCYNDNNNNKNFYSANLHGNMIKCALQI